MRVDAAKARLVSRHVINQARTEICYKFSSLHSEGSPNLAIAEFRLGENAGDTRIHFPCMVEVCPQPIVVHLWLLSATLPRPASRRIIVEQVTDSRHHDYGVAGARVGRRSWK
jgi:hypothetical protein